MDARIVQFADPLNPRGWVAEPTRRRVALAFPDVRWTVRPVGMVESWDAYDGTEIEGGRAGMAATCARLAEGYGMPTDEYLWFDEPPTSSWLACRAIAAAGLQDAGSAGDPDAAGGGDPGAGGSGLGERLLRACREATFARRRSISDPGQLRAVVESVTALDADDVAAALDDGRADEAFEAARAEAAAVDAPGVERAGGRCVLPTLVVRADGEARAVPGVADFAAYRAALETVADVEPAEDTPDVEAVLERFSPEGWVARAELADLVDRSGAEVEVAVEPLVESGEVVEETLAAEPFWRLAEYVTGNDEVDGDGDDMAAPDEPDEGDG